MLEEVILCQLKEKRTVGATAKAIEKYKQENDGVAPTVRELCHIVGVSSTSTMFSYLKELEERGVISRVNRSPRNIGVN